MHKLRKGSDALFSYILRNKKWALLAVAVVFLAIVFGSIILPAFAIIIMGVIASFSTSYKRFIRMPPAVELVTFTTVMVSLAYGPLIGAIYAAVVTLTAEIMTNALDIFIISFIPARVVIALIAGYAYSFWDGGMLATGFTLSIIYNLVAQPFYLFLADAQMRVKSMFFIFINIGSNFIFFAVFGKLVAQILGI